MKKVIKSLVASILIITLFLSSFSIFASENIDNNELYSQGNLTQQLRNNSKEIVVGKCDYKAKIDEFDMPKEVADRLNEIFTNDEYENADVHVYAPVKQSGIVPLGSSGSWGRERIYKGYTLKDWVVTIENGFGMTSILGPSSSVAQFCSALLVYCGSLVIDSVIPFGSAAVTLLDFIRSHEGNYVMAGSGDKASAAPIFLTYETFTYVNTDRGFVLGTRTYYSSLESIAWYYYSSKMNDDYIYSNKYLTSFRSANSGNLNDAAIRGLGAAGPVLDSPISIKIGNTTFVFK